MEVFQVIVHHINKEQGATESSLVLSDRLLDASEEKTEDLVKRLDVSYRNKSVQYAHFREIGNEIPNRFRNINDNRDNDSFINTTKLLTRDLFTRISSIATASGGYIVFCDYSPAQDHRMLGVFLIRMTDSFLFNEEHEQSEEGDELVTFSIGDIEHLDLRRLAMACKINLTNFANGSVNKYLSLIKSGQPDISDYFYNWLHVDIEDIESDKEYTSNLIKIVETIPTPVDEETGEEIGRTQFIRDVAQYISMAEAKSINLKAMSNYFFREEDFIENFAEENNIPINTEFKVHPGESKRFQQFVFKTREIHLQFPRRLLDEERVATNDEGLVVIRDEEIYEMVQREIEKLRNV